MLCHDYIFTFKFASKIIDKS
uniref:Uncharacterized protein n=1 Tax=Arundo donax TaxID=35708 RepID=A0A0A9FPY0_ARUDO